MLISTSIRKVLLFQNSFKWQYKAVAGAEIMDKVGAGAEHWWIRNFFLDTDQEILFLIWIQQEFCF